MAVGSKVPFSAYSRNGSQPGNMLIAFLMLHTEAIANSERSRWAIGIGWVLEGLLARLLATSGPTLYARKQREPGLHLMHLPTTHGLLQASAAVTVTCSCCSNHTGTHLSTRPLHD